MLITLRGLMGLCVGVSLSHKVQIFGTKRKKKKNRVLAYKEAPNTSSKFNYDTLC